MKLVLHLGMPKTGTSAIQSALGDSRDALRGRGVAYTRAAGEKGSQWRFLAQAVRAAGREAWDHAFSTGFHGRGFDDIGDPDAFGREFRAEVAGAGTVIVSSEAFWVRTRDVVVPRAVARYCERLLAPSETTLVVYLRRQDRHIPSAYAQMVRGGHDGQMEAMTGTTLPPYCYRDRLADWTEAHPGARLVVVPYEHGGLIDGDAVADFDARLGLDLDRTVMGRRENASIDGASIALLRRLNALLPPRTADGRNRRSRMVAARAIEQGAVQEGAGGAPLALDRTTAESVMARYAAQNEAVARDVLGREDGKLFSDGAIMDAYDGPPTSRDANDATLEATFEAAIDRMLTGFDDEIERLLAVVERQRAGLRARDALIERMRPSASPAAAEGEDV